MKRIRLAALFTLFFFSFSCINVPAQVSGAPAAAELKNFPSDLTSIRLPAQMGKIEDLYIGSGDQTVVVIQDAHAIPDAQKSIQKIIAYFQKRYGVSFVGLEGASSQLDPQIFRSFPDKKLLRQVFSRYLQNGELTAGTGAAIFSADGGRDMIFHGVENWDLYEQGLGLYLAALKEETELLKKVEGGRSRVEGEKKKAYSEKLFEIDQKLELFRSNKIDLVSVMKALAAIKRPSLAKACGRSNLDLPPSTCNNQSLTAFLEEIESEGNDNTPPELEVKQMAEKVKRSLEHGTIDIGHRTEDMGKRNVLRPKSYALRQFNAKYQDFQTSRISAPEFALYLKEWVNRRGAIHGARSQGAIKGPGAINRAPTFQFSKRLSHLMDHQKTLRNIEGTKFFRDFEHYAQSVKESLMTTEEQRKLDAETRELNLMEKLVKLELSREEWNELEKRRGDTAIGRHGEENKEFQVHLAFYRNAELRDQAFLKNLTRFFAASPRHRVSQSALLIAGGFHAQGLTQRLKDKNISYLLVMPQIRNIPKNTHYREHMKGNVSWKKYFEVENGKINLYKAFVRGTRDRLLGVSEYGSNGVSERNHLPRYPDTPTRRHVLKHWRDQIIRDLADQKRIEKAGEYTRFIDELKFEVGSSKFGETLFKPPTSNFKLKEALSKINRFIAGLRKLQSENQLTEPNIVNLLKPATTADVATAAALQPNVTYAIAGFDKKGNFLSPRISDLIQQDEILVTGNSGGAEVVQNNEQGDGAISRNNNRSGDAGLGINKMVPLMPHAGKTGELEDPAKRLIGNRSDARQSLKGQFSMLSGNERRGSPVVTGRISSHETFLAQDIGQSPKLGAFLKKQPDGDFELPAGRVNTIAATRNREFRAQTNKRRAFLEDERSELNVSHDVQNIPSNKTKVNPASGSTGKASARLKAARSEAREGPARAEVRRSPGEQEGAVEGIRFGGVRATPHVKSQWEPFGEAHAVTPPGEVPSGTPLTAPPSQTVTRSAMRDQTTGMNEQESLYIDRLDGILLRFERGGNAVDLAAVIDQSLWRPIMDGEFTPAGHNFFEALFDRIPSVFDEDLFGKEERVLADIIRLAITHNANLSIFLSGLIDYLKKKPSAWDYRQVVGAVTQAINAMPANARKEIALQFDSEAYFKEVDDSGFDIDTKLLLSHLVLFLKKDISEDWERTFDDLWNRYGADAQNELIQIAPEQMPDDESAMRSSMAKVALLVLFVRQKLLSDIAPFSSKAYNSRYLRLMDAQESKNAGSVNTRLRYDRQFVRKTVKTFGIAIAIYAHEFSHYSVDEDDAGEEFVADVFAMALGEQLGLDDMTFIQAMRYSENYEMVQENPVELEAHARARHLLSVYHHLFNWALSNAPGRFLPWRAMARIIVKGIFKKNRLDKTHTDRIPRKDSELGFNEFSSLFFKEFGREFSSLLESATQKYFPGLAVNDVLNLYEDRLIAAANGQGQDARQRLENDYSALTVPELLKERNKLVMAIEHSLSQEYSAKEELRYPRDILQSKLASLDRVIFDKIITRHKQSGEAVKIYWYEDGRQNVAEISETLADDMAPFAAFVPQIIDGVPELVATAPSITKASLSDMVLEEKIANEAVGDGANVKFRSESRMIVTENTPLKDVVDYVMRKEGVIGAAIDGGRTIPAFALHGVPDYERTRPEDNDINVDYYYWDPNDDRYKNLEQEDLKRARPGLQMKPPGSQSTELSMRAQNFLERFYGAVNRTRAYSQFDTANNIFPIIHVFGQTGKHRFTFWLDIPANDGQTGMYPLQVGVQNKSLILRGRSPKTAANGAKVGELTVNKKEVEAAGRWAKEKSYSQTAFVTLLLYAKALALIEAELKNSGAIRDKPRPQSFDGQVRQEARAETRAVESEWKEDGTIEIIFSAQPNTTGLKDAPKNTEWAKDLVKAGYLSVQEDIGWGKFVPTTVLLQLTGGGAGMAAIRLRGKNYLIKIGKGSIGGFSLQSITSGGRRENYIEGNPRVYDEVTEGINPERLVLDLLRDAAYFETKPDFLTAENIFSKIIDAAVKKKKAMTVQELSEKISVALTQAGFQHLTKTPQFRPIVQQMASILDFAMGNVKETSLPGIRLILYPEKNRISINGEEFDSRIKSERIFSEDEKAFPKDVRQQIKTLLQDPQTPLSSEVKQALRETALHFVFPGVENPNQYAEELLAKIQTMEPAKPLEHQLPIHALHGIQTLEEWGLTEQKVDISEAMRYEKYGVPSLDEVLAQGMHPEDASRFAANQTLNVSPPALETKMLKDSKTVTEARKRILAQLALHGPLSFNELQQATGFSSEFLRPFLEEEQSWKEEGEQVSLLVDRHSLAPVRMNENYLYELIDPDKLYEEQKTVLSNVREKLTEAMDILIAADQVVSLLQGEEGLPIEGIEAPVKIGALITNEQAERSKQERVLRAIFDLMKQKDMIREEYSFEDWAAKLGEGDAIWKNILVTLFHFVDHAVSRIQAVQGYEQLTTQMTTSRYGFSSDIVKTLDEGIRDVFGTLALLDSAAMLEFIFQSDFKGPVQLFADFRQGGIDGQRQKLEKMLDGVESKARELYEQRKNLIDGEIPSLSQLDVVQKTFFAANSTPAEWAQKLEENIRVPRLLVQEIQKLKAEGKVDVGQIVENLQFKKMTPQVVQVAKVYIRAKLAGNQQEMITSIKVIFSLMDARVIASGQYGARELHGHKMVDNNHQVEKSNDALFIDSLFGIKPSKLTGTRKVSDVTEYPYLNQVIFIDYLIAQTSGDELNAKKLRRELQVLFANAYIADVTGKFKSKGILGDRSSSPMLAAGFEWRDIHMIQETIGEIVELRTFLRLETTGQMTRETYLAYRRQMMNAFRREASLLRNAKKLEDYENLDIEKILEHLIYSRHTMDFETGLAIAQQSEESETRAETRSGALMNFEVNVLPYFLKEARSLADEGISYESSPDLRLDAQRAMAALPRLAGLALQLQEQIKKLEDPQNDPKVEFKHLSSHEKLFINNLTQAVRWEKTHTVEDEMMAFSKALQNPPSGGRTFSPIRNYYLNLIFSADQILNPPSRSEVEVYGLRGNREQPGSRAEMRVEGPRDENPYASSSGWTLPRRRAEDFAADLMTEASETIPRVPREIISKIDKNIGRRKAITAESFLEIVTQSIEEWLKERIQVEFPSFKRADIGLRIVMHDPERKFYDYQILKGEHLIEVIVILQPEKLSDPQMNELQKADDRRYLQKRFSPNIGTVGFPIATYDINSNKTVEFLSSMESHSGVARALLANLANFMMAHLDEAQNSARAETRMFWPHDPRYRAFEQTLSDQGFPVDDIHEWGKLLGYREDWSGSIMTPSAKRMRKGAFEIADILEKSVHSYDADGILRETDAIIQAIDKELEDANGPHTLFESRGPFLGQRVDVLARSVSRDGNDLIEIVLEMVFDRDGNYQPDQPKRAALAAAIRAYFEAHTQLQIQRMALAKRNDLVAMIRKSSKALGDQYKSPENWKEFLREDLHLADAEIDKILKEASYPGAEEGPEERADARAEARLMTGQSARPETRQKDVGQAPSAKLSGEAAGVSGSDQQSRGLAAGVFFPGNVVSPKKPAADQNGYGNTQKHDWIHTLSSSLIGFSQNRQDEGPQKATQGRPADPSRTFFEEMTDKPGAANNLSDIGEDTGNPSSLLRSNNNLHSTVLNPAPSVNGGNSRTVHSIYKLINSQLNNDNFLNKAPPVNLPNTAPAGRHAEGFDSAQPEMRAGEVNQDIRTIAKVVINGWETQAEEAASLVRAELRRMGMEPFVENLKEATRQLVEEEIRDKIARSGELVSPEKVNGMIQDRVKQIMASIDRKLVLGLTITPEMSVQDIKDYLRAIIQSSGVIELVVFAGETKEVNFKELKEQGVHATTVKQMDNVRSTTLSSQRVLPEILQGAGNPSTNTLVVKVGLEGQVDDPILRIGAAFMQVMLGLLVAANIHHADELKDADKQKELVRALLGPVTDQSVVRFNKEGLPSINLEALKNFIQDYEASQATGHAA